MKTHILKQVVKLATLILCLSALNTQAQADTITPTGKQSDQTLLLILHVNGKAVTVKKTFTKNLTFYAKSADDNETYHYTLLSKNNKTLYTGQFHN